MNMLLLLQSAFEELILAPLRIKQPFISNYGNGWAKLPKIYGLRKPSLSSSEATTALGHTTSWTAREEPGTAPESNGAEIATRRAGTFEEVIGKVSGPKIRSSDAFDVCGGPSWAQTLIFSSLATFYDDCPEAESAH